MKPIKLVALDVDGTLLDPSEEIRPRVRAAVREAIDKGCLVTLATGRRFVGAREIAADLELALPLILHGGAVIQDSATQAVIYQDPHEPETVEAVVRLFLSHDRQAVVYESPAFGGRIFASDRRRDNEPVRQYDTLRGPMLRLPDDELGNVRHVLSVATMGAFGELIDLAGQVAAIPGTAPLLTAWRMFEYEAIEVFREGCSKAKALEHLAAAHGIGMDEVMAIGDGLNDCEILAAVGLGVAMGNACPEARAAARIQVGTNEQDGVAEAIERYVLRA